MSLYFHAPVATPKFIDLFIIYYLIILKITPHLHCLGDYVDQVEVYMYFSHTYLAPSPVNLTIILLDYFLFLLIYILYIFNINLLSATHVRNIFPQSHICPLYLPMVFFFLIQKKIFLIILPKVIISWLSQLSTWREFLGMVQRRGTQAEAGSASELRWQSWESREGSVSEREEQHRERPPGICSLFPVRIQLSTDQCMCVRKLPEAKERTNPKD